MMVWIRMQTSTAGRDRDKAPIGMQCMNGRYMPLEHSRILGLKPPMAHKIHKIQSYGSMAPSLAIENGQWLRHGHLRSVALFIKDERKKENG